VNLNGRVEKLEAKRLAERYGQRCEVCQDWRPNRFECEDKRFATDTPEECSCGFRPRLIRINLVTNWREWRADRTTE
jgi:hypothetical protein